MSDDLISRKAAIAKFEPWLKVEGYSEGELNMLKAVLYELTVMPSAQPSLYGYKIEHLAYIAKVMEKEGVTAEYAVRTFDDMIRLGPFLGASWWSEVPV